MSQKPMMKKKPMKKAMVPMRPMRMLKTAMLML